MTNQTDVIVEKEICDSVIPEKPKFLVQRLRGEVRGSRVVRWGPPDPLCSSVGLDNHSIASIYEVFE